MLFASTRLTLVRELGSEHFSEAVFCTEPEELTEKGWEKHLAHTESGNPLTEQEREARDLDEVQAVEGRGTQGKSLVQGGQISLRVSEDIVKALQVLGRDGDDNLVQLRMDVPTETLQLVSSTSASPATLSTSIDASEPRYSFYRHDDTEASVVFISTCPSAAKIKERMLYAASRANVISMAQSEGGLSVAKRIEATNPEEVTEQSIADEFKTEKVEEKKGFARPKRPGKR